VAPVARVVEERVREVGRALRELGADVREGARPDIDAAASHRVFGALLQSFVAAGFPASVYDELVRKAAALAPDDASDAAQMLRAQTLRHRDWIAFHESRTRLRWAWQRFFQAHDLVVMPVAATSAFPRDEGAMEARRIDVDGTEQGHYQQMFWAGLAGVAQLPSTVVPTGPDANGLPIGVQLVAPAWGDRVALGAAAALEAVGFSFRPPPGYA
jgi:amidase